jgi:carboxymethylenebutenolidase
MGGPLSFQTAGAVPGRIGAVASFHGGGLVTDQPNSPHLLLPKTRAEYLSSSPRTTTSATPSPRRSSRPPSPPPAPAQGRGLPRRPRLDRPRQRRLRGAEAERAWAELLALYKRALV